jgi:hypothetical protein
MADLSELLPLRDGRGKVFFLYELVVLSKVYDRPTI